MGGTCSTANTTVRGSQLSLGDNDYPVTKILILGPSKAGKSHLLYCWIHGIEDEISVPQTQDFNMERILSQKSGMIFTMWEVSGQPNMKYKRRNFFYGTQGLVYVISSDKRSEKNWENTKEDLLSLCQETDLKDVPLLVVVNKFSGTDTLSLNEIKMQLDLCEHPDLEKRCSFIEVDCKLSSDVDRSLSILESLVLPSSNNQNIKT